MADNADRSDPRQPRHPRQPRQPHDPISRFEAVWARARATAAEGGAGADPTAVVLATADAAGRPSARVVLLKAVDPRGFVFFTNYESRKARELAANPHAALCFFWPWLGEQVRVEGAVERVSDGESDAYFASRGRRSQLGAWASRQSRPLATRFGLLRRFVVHGLHYAGGPVPRPPFWGGFRLLPERVEFWRNAPDRLHHRRLYERAGDGWESRRLYP